MQKHQKFWLVVEAPGENTSSSNIPPIQHYKREDAIKYAEIITRNKGITTILMESVEYCVAAKPIWHKMHIEYEKKTPCCTSCKFCKTISINEYSCMNETTEKILDKEEIEDGCDFWSAS
jgi:hypothetical protein